MTFTVGKDGKIVDKDLVAKNELGGEADGAWNKTAWQADAFYGNPLAGFAYFQYEKPEVILDRTAQ